MKEPMDNYTIEVRNERERIVIVSEERRNMGETSHER